MLAFGIANVLSFGHLTKYIVVPHCYFGLHFPDNMLYRAYFHMFICCLSIFGEVSIMVFGQFFNLVVFLFLFCFKHSSYILNNRPLSDTSFAF